MATKKNHLKKRSKIMTVLRKVKNRYFYNSQLIFNTFERFKKTRARVRVEDCGGNQKTKEFARLKDVVSVSQQQLLKQEHQPLIRQYPFLITSTLTPKIKMPKTLQATLHIGPKIDYTENSLYYRISCEQVLEKFKENTHQNIAENSDQLNISVPQMELKAQEYEIPHIVNRLLTSIYKVNVWVYGGDRVSQWHYDGHDNLLYVLEGKKVVFLAKPSAIQAKNVFSLYNNHSKNQTTIFQRECVRQAVVTNGSCLFIPKGWWHKVYSYGASNIAVNYWGNSVAQILTHLSKVDKSLILKDFLFSIADNYCRKTVPNWQLLPEEQKQIMRKSAGHALIEIGIWQWHEKVKKEPQN